MGEIESLAIPDVERTKGRYGHALTLAEELGMRPPWHTAILASENCIGERAICSKPGSISLPRPQ
jgi:hypothetical protein